MSKHLQCDNLSIAYEEYNSDREETLFFIHGNSGSNKTWYKQMGDAWLSPYRQIAIELPGHGHSSHSLNPNEDYSPIVTAKILTAVVKKLAGNGKFILVGLSYGTNIIAEMINSGLQANGVILLGMCCIGENFGMDKVFRPTEIRSIFFYNEIDEKKVLEFMRLCAKGEADVIRHVKDYLNTDKNFRPALMKAATEGKFTDEIVALKNVGVIVCVINGGADPIIFPDYLNASAVHFWNHKVDIIQHARHFVHLDSPQEVNQAIADYAKEVFTKVQVFLQN